MSGSPPASVIRDGNLKASIWENEGNKGTYFTTTIAKTYRDGNDKIRDTNVFNNSDLLRVSELARQAYGRTNELRQEHLQSQAPTQSLDSRADRVAEYLKNRRQENSNEREQER